MALRAIMATGSLALVLAGCGALGVDAGPRTTEDREVDDVTAVALETSGDLVVELGDTPSLTITAGERVLDRLTSEVHDGVLVLGSKGRGWADRGEIEYHLVVTELQAVHLRGSGDIEADAVTGDALEVVLEGSGDVRLDGVDVDALQVQVDGSGDVVLAGRAGRQAVTLGGSGGYDGGDLRSDDATVSLDGSGDVQVDVAGSLSATVDGSGSVTYTGSPDVESDVQGSGTVRAG
jgi:Putative auto-transporter adhesin, head GIN domain